MTITLTPARIFVALVGIALLGWLLWPAGHPQWPVAKLAAAPTRLVVFGDSLTTGFNLREPQKSFPHELGRCLGLPVQVEGLNGCTLPVGVERLAQIDFGTPALVLVCLGGNDQLRGVAPERSLAAMEAIFSHLQAKGHAVVFVEVLAPFSGRSKEWHRLCKEKQVAIVPDVMRGLLSDASLMVDTIHPNELGCALLAERSHEAIRVFGLIEAAKN